MSAKLSSKKLLNKKTTDCRKSKIENERKVFKYIILMEKKKLKTKTVQITSQLFSLKSKKIF